MEEKIMDMQTCEIILDNPLGRLLHVFPGKLHKDSKSEEEDHFTWPKAWSKQDQL